MESDGTGRYQYQREWTFLSFAVWSTINRDLCAIVVGRRWFESSFTAGSSVHRSRRRTCDVRGVMCWRTTHVRTDCYLPTDGRIVFVLLLAWSSKTPHRSRWWELVGGQPVKEILLLVKNDFMMYVWYLQYPSQAGSTTTFNSLLFQMWAWSKNKLEALKKQKQEEVSFLPACCLLLWLVISCCRRILWSHI